jgi:hypothetical protein
MSVGMRKKTNAGSSQQAKQRQRLIYGLGQDCFDPVTAQIMRQRIYKRQQSGLVESLTQKPESPMKSSGCAKNRALHCPISLWRLENNIANNHGPSGLQLLDVTPDEGFRRNTQPGIVNG